MLTVTTEEDRRAPADLLLRPVPLVALALLVFNDLLFKRSWPGLVTGKLSDVAGMVYLPLILMAFIELVRSRLHWPWQVGNVAIASCVLGTVAVFGLAKLSPSAAGAYGDLMGWIRWPVVHPWRSVHVTHDLTDLLTLPAAGLAWWDARRARAAVPAHP